MLIVFKSACLSLLFLLVYAAVQQLIVALTGTVDAKRRLYAYGVRRLFGRMKTRRGARTKLTDHLAELIASSRTGGTPGIFLFVTAALALAGTIAGALLFNSIKGTAAAGLLLASLPYLRLRMRLITMRMKTGYRLLPAIEVFYQCYVLATPRNIRQVLKTAIEANRMPSPIRDVFEQLYRNLTIHADTDRCLRLFALSLGNSWAEHFTGLLRNGLREGADLAPGLKELIADMRAGAKADRLERNRLLEIRIANFSPLLFLAVFLFVNFRVGHEQAWSYYVLSAEGRDMLLDALILIAASFAMGIYLSLRRM